MDAIGVAGVRRSRAETGAVAVMLALAAGAVIEAEPGSAAVSAHVRSAHARLSGALDHGRRHSRTFADLMATLDASDVVVYLYDGGCESPTPSCLRLASTGPGRRVVRVDFQLTGGRRNASIEHYDLLVAQIAHELQHAAEIAADVTVVDADTLAGRYERIGRRRQTPRGVAYETEAALKVGRLVLQELRANRRRLRAAGGPAGGAVSGTADQR